MELVKSYSDLTVIEKALIDQINITKHELYVWYGIDVDSDADVPMSGKSSRKMSLPSAVEQAQDRSMYLSRLEARLDAVRFKIKRLDWFMDQLDGLDHKIAYGRLVKDKAHKEIAEELGYTEQYIRLRWSRINERSTDAVEKT